MPNGTPQRDLERGEMLVAEFTDRFGDAHRALAEHAALPLVLTPELVNYLHGEFLRRELPHYEATANLLLSELCREIGYEQYAMDRDARAFLLAKMQERGDEAVQAVASKLLGYVGYLARTRRAYERQELKNQQWAAMVYLDDTRDAAVEELVERINHCLLAGESAGPAITTSRSELTRLARLVEEFAPQLQQYPEFVERAQLIGRLLADASGAVAAEATRDQTLTQRITVAGVEMAGLRSLLRLREKPVEQTAQDVIPLVAGDHQRLTETLQSALEIARLLEDKGEEARVRIRLGQAFLDTGAFRGAVEQYGVASELSQDASTQLPAFSGLAHAQFRQGHWGEADTFFARALEIAEAQGDEAWIATTLDMLGLIHLEMTDYQGSIEYYERALRIHQQRKDRPQLARTLAKMGRVHTASNDDRNAFDCYRQAALLFAELGERSDEAAMGEACARAMESLGQRDDAIEFAEGALALFDEINLEDAGRVRAFLDRLRTTPPRVSSLEVDQAVVPPRFSTFTFETVTFDETGREIERRKLQARQFVEELGDGVTLEMVEVGGGEFLMGTSDEDAKFAREEAKRQGYDPKWIDEELPQHKVKVPPVYIGRFTITQRQWRIVAGWPKIKNDLKPEPSYFRGDDRPVEQISWHDTQEFCARLAAKTGRAYRLPTEAEWEYACRARTTTPFAFGETITPAIVNYDGNYPYAKAGKGSYREETVPAGSLGVANAFGLYDLHGNVWEWCEDVWHKDYKGAPTDSSAWLSGGDSSSRLLRGGSWGFRSIVCRSAYRYNDSPDDRGDYIGVRVVVARVS